MAAADSATDALAELWPVLIQEECKAVAQDLLLKSAAKFAVERAEKRKEPISAVAEAYLEEVIEECAKKVVVHVSRKYAEEVIEQQKVINAQRQIVEEFLTENLNRMAVEELDTFAVQNVLDALVDEHIVECSKEFLFKVYPSIEKETRERERQKNMDRVVGTMGRFIFRHAALRQLATSGAKRHADYLSRQNQDALVHRVMLARLVEILNANCSIVPPAQVDNRRSREADQYGSGAVASASE